MSIRNRINELLFPIAGLDLTPVYPESGEVFLGQDIPLQASYLVGKANIGSVLIEGTADGSLKVANTGSGLTSYEVFTGTTTDTATALGVAVQCARADFFFYDAAVTVNYVDAQTATLGAFDLAIGTSSQDFSFSDIKVKSKASGVHSTYQVIVWN